MINNKLNKLKCSSCNRSTPILNESEISKNLEDLSNWNLNDEKNMIFKKLLFKDFKQSIKFANEVGKISEKELHHADISFGYGYCLLMIHTHAIKGLSINDFILASKIDLINI